MSPLVVLNAINGPHIATLAATIDNNMFLVIKLHMANHSFVVASCSIPR